MDHHVLDQMTGGVIFGLPVYHGIWTEKISWSQFSSFDQLKLRASYGYVGNGGIGNYDWFPSYSFASSYNNIPGSVPGNVGNLDLSWEVNKPLNIGLDVSVLESRLNVSMDWYNRKSEELLLNVPLSPTSGFASQTQNVGEMENQGIEVTIVATPVRSKDFTWTVNFNFAYNKNKVLTLPGGNPIIGTFIIKEGLDVQSFYPRVYAGVDPANGDPLWYLDSTRKATTNVYSSAQNSIWFSITKIFWRLDQYTYL